MNLLSLTPFSSPLDSQTRRAGTVAAAVGLQGAVWGRGGLGPGRTRGQGDRLVGAQFALPAPSRACERMACLSVEVHFT